MRVAPSVAAPRERQAQRSDAMEVVIQTLTSSRREFAGDSSRSSFPDARPRNGIAARHHCLEQLSERRRMDAGASGAAGVSQRVASARPCSVVDAAQGQELQIATFGVPEHHRVIDRLACVHYQL